MHFIRYIVTMFNVLYCISYENIGLILNVKLLTEVVQVVNIRSFEARKKIFFYSPSRFSVYQELLFPNKILFAELDIIKSIKEGNSIFGEI